jgi:hypothetical protein
MNQLDNITHKIAELLGRPYDVALLRSLEDSAWNLRATFIRREYDKTKIVHEDLIQDLGCIPLEMVDAAECCEIDSGCKVKRTVHPVPKPVRFKREEPFEYVGDIDHSPEYVLTTAGELELILHHSEVPSIYPYYIYRNGYIYTTAQVKYLRVRGVFETPSEASIFNDCKDSHCDTEEEAFIPGDMAELIETELLRKYRLQQTDGKDEVKI